MTYTSGRVNLCVYVVGRSVLPIILLGAVSLPRLLIRRSDLYQQTILSVAAADAVLPPNGVDLNSHRR